MKSTLLIPRSRWLALLALCVLEPQLSTLFAQTTAFTYQGRLVDGDKPAAGNYDLKFTLFDALSNGTAVGGPMTNAMTSVSNGVFTVPLDFGAQVFAGADRWLEIGVRNNGTGTWTALDPRQLITPAPVALAARYASTAATVTTVPPTALPPTVVQQNTNSEQLYFQSFENSTFPPPGWVNPNTVAWYRDTATHSEGVACAASGPIDNWTSCELYFTNNASVASQLSFDWRISGEAAHTFLQFYVDGTPLRSISGEVEWTAVTLPLTAGRHVLRWLYENRNVTNMARVNQGWLDNIRVRTFPGTLGTTTPLMVADEAHFTGNVGIGTTTPSQLLHLDATPGHGEGMQIDSGIAGHAPAIYLNHTAYNGRKFRLASYGNNTQAGMFIIRDDTANADRLMIDYTGTVNMGSVFLSGDLGVHTAPTRAIDVDGVIGVANASRILNAGIRAEDNSQLIDIGINDGLANRFGGTYTPSSQGGFLRIDGRSYYPLFSFFARSAGTTGEVTQVASISTGGTVTATAFNPSSDRNLKENFQPLDPLHVLEKVAALPLNQWNFKSEPSVAHMGPMAQDFYEAFGVGTDDRHIATVDADGVALAAIQGLNKKLEAQVKERDARITHLEKELSDLKQLVRSLVPKSDGAAN